MFIHELPDEKAWSETVGQPLTAFEGLDYITETDATASKVFTPEQVGQMELYVALKHFADAATNLDRYKKALFRKRTREESGLSTVLVHEKGPPLDQLIAGMGHDYLFHGVIGVATESGELAEVLLKLLNGERVDVTNVKEEIGDVLWYLARLIKWADTTFLTEMKRNIAKLRARHGPSGFSKEGDMVRDLDRERKVLGENGAGNGLTDDTKGEY